MNPDGWLFLVLPFSSSFVVVVVVVVDIPIVCTTLGLIPSLWLLGSLSRKRNHGREDETAFSGRVFAFHATKTSYLSSFQGRAQLAFVFSLFFSMSSGSSVTSP